TLKDDFVGMAFWTAHHNLVEFWLLFWSRIVRRLVAPHCLPSPRNTDLHDLHADAIRKIRGHLIHVCDFLRAHEEWDSRLVEDSLQLKRIALAPHRAELNQFAVFLVLVFLS